MRRLPENLEDLCSMVNISLLDEESDRWESRRFPKTTKVILLLAFTPLCGKYLQLLPQKVASTSSPLESGLKPLTKKVWKHGRDNTVLIASLGLKRPCMFQHALWRPCYLLCSRHKPGPAGAWVGVLECGEMIDQMGQAGTSHLSHHLGQPVPCRLSSSRTT